MKKNTPNPTQTILTIVIGLILFYLITDIQFLIHLSFILGAIGLFSTYLSKVVDYLWIKLAWVLSLIVPNILLSIIFYLILFPIALISKIFHKDTLKIKKQKASIYKEINKTFVLEDLKNPW